MNSVPTAGDQSPQIGNLFPAKTSNSSIWFSAGGWLGLHVVDPSALRGDREARRRPFDLENVAEIPLTRKFEPVRGPVLASRGWAKG